MSILRLQHTRTDGEVDTYHLKSVRRYHIGRGSNCEVRILDLKMSRQHAAVDRQGSEWILHDLGSTNGVKLDGKRIQGSTVLTVGSVIKAGNTELSVAGIEARPGSGPSKEDLTPVRQEALPDPESDDEVPVSDSQDDGVEPEPQAMAPAAPEPEPAAKADNPSTSDELPLGDTAGDATGALESLDGSAAPSKREEADQALSSEPTPPDSSLHVAAKSADPTPMRPSAIIRPGTEDGSATEPSPAATLTLDTPASAEPAPAPVEPPPAAAPPAPAVAASTPPPSSGPTPAPATREPQRDASGKVKPVTIRVGSAAPERSDDSSSLYINLLGRRIGPLSRAEARELKARELKGTLTEADLANYPGA